MASAAQQQAFVQTYSPYATQAGAALGVAPSVILGQWANESAWGTSNLATGSNNLAGITQSGGSSYASYASPQDFTNSYIATLQNPRYASALGTGNDPYGFTSGLASGGYFTSDPGTYAANVASASSTITGYDPSLAAPVMASGPTDYGYGGTPVTSNMYQPASWLSDLGSNLSQWYFGGEPALGPSVQSDLQGGQVAASLPGLGTTIGLAPGLARGVTDWLGSLESNVTDLTSQLFTGTEKFVIRGFLILVAVVVIAIALWRILDPESSSSTGKAVRGAAASAAAFL